MEDLQSKFAEVAKCWVKYGLFLFSVSKTNIVSQFCGEPNAILDRLWSPPFNTVDKSAPLQSNSTEAVLQDDARTQEEHTTLLKERKAFAPSRDSPSTLPKLLEDAQQSETRNRTRMTAEEYQGNIR